ncbi:MAG TPA: hypothetical protein VN672_10945 [Solirubrobacteraceae bacterium]|nr:hypothetical protein [Solirubrobacteraceae bacterium]
MAKTWVLDTETKGTGAHMAPLPSARTRELEKELALVKLDRPSRRARPQAPPQRLRFKVVDVLGGRVLGEDVDASEAVRLLEGLRSMLDARVSVRSPKTGRWRVLGIEQQRVLWRFRGRVDRRETAPGS